MDFTLHWDFCCLYSDSKGLDMAQIRFSMDLLEAKLKGYKQSKKHHIISSNVIAIETHIDTYLASSTPSWFMHLRSPPPLDAPLF